jgi:hypothetical protein
LQQNKKFFCFPVLQKIALAHTSLEAMSVVFAVSVSAVIQAYLDHHKDGPNSDQNFILE